MTNENETVEQTFATALKLKGRLKEVNEEREKMLTDLQAAQGRLQTFGVMLDISDVQMSERYVEPILPPVAVQSSPQRQSPQQEQPIQQEPSRQEEVSVPIPEQSEDKALAHIAAAFDKAVMGGLDIADQNRKMAAPGSAIIGTRGYGG